MRTVAKRGIERDDCIRAGRTKVRSSLNTVDINGQSGVAASGNDVTGARIAGDIVGIGRAAIVGRDHVRRDRRSRPRRIKHETGAAGRRIARRIGDGCRNQIVAIRHAAERATGNRPATVATDNARYRLAVIARRVADQYTNRCTGLRARTGNRQTSRFACIDRTIAADRRDIASNGRSVINGHR